MSSGVILPALDGRTPLGFLAACGVLRIADEELGFDSRLCWSVRDGTATVAVEGCATLAALVERLTEFVMSFDEGQLLPGGPVGFPAGGAGPDPMRMDRAEFRSVTQEWRAEHGDQFVERWVPAMVSDLAVDDGGRVHHTLLAAPSGQQKFHSMFAKNLAKLRENPHELIDEALRAWRRHDGVTGEYLDHRVLRSTTDDARGRKLMEAGIPGATWLALMAMPWFPVGGDGRERGGAGWRSLGRLHLVWPLWHPLLDGAAVRALIGHPSIGPEREGSGLRVRTAGCLDALGIFAVIAARREGIEGRKSAGVLVPVPVSLG